MVAKGLGKPVQKDGVEYLQVEKVVTKVKIAHGQVQFDDTERPLAGNFIFILNIDYLMDGWYPAKGQSLPHLTEDFEAIRNVIDICTRWKSLFVRLY